MRRYANLGMMKQSYLNMMCGCLQDITALLLSRSSVPIVGLWNCRAKVQIIDNNIEYQMYYY